MLRLSRIEYSRVRWIRGCLRNGFVGSSKSCRSLTSLDRSQIRGPHGAYLEEYKRSIENPKDFWAKASTQIHWFKDPQSVLTQESEYQYRWFADGVLNMSYNCLDVHVLAGRGDQVALIYDSPVTQIQERYTYRQLLDHVSRFAGVLKKLGVQSGDRVVIYMPMIPHAIVAMLACARIGAIHSVVFGGFASAELAKRITDCRPKVVVSASVGVEPTRIIPYKPLLDKALEIADHGIQHTIIVQRRNVQECLLDKLTDRDYDELMAQSEPVDATPVTGSHPHSILYTSGTTGIPKGVLRDTAGWAVALKWSMGAFYDTNPGEVFWSASDVGWIVGHSYIVYGPLLQGCTTILYEGKPVGTPDAGAFWRVMSEHKVKTFFVAPTAFRAIKQADPHAELVQKYDLSSLRTLFLAGEHSDPDTLHYCERALERYGDVSKPIDHWWQTELGWPGVGNAVGLGRIPLVHGACAAPVPGYIVHIVDPDTGKVLPQGQLGDMVLKLPLPPGTLMTLYNDDERFIREYLTKYPGYYDAKDAALIDELGYIHIVGRIDEVINVAGHRLSTGGMEEILMEHEEVADCAVFPVKDKVKGQIPIGLVILNQDSTISEDQLKKELIMNVRDALGPVANFRKVAKVDRLPKTRSGKILRATMTKIGNGQPYEITPTIEDPNIFEYLEPIIQRLVAEK